ncbi:MAG: hypothetical protein KBS67_04505 [Bacteroidales bacterium]|nr:hypothetical protein [Candidatus Cryptobacteroides equifaecalis]
MKAVFIAYNQAYNEEIVELLEANGQRGFTRWDETSGRGSVDGEPHLGNHAWPTQNHAILTMVEDDKVAGILADLKKADEQSKDLGLRAFVWNIEMFC